MTDEGARLAALAQLDVLDSPPEERFDRVTRLCARLFDVPTAAVTLVARDTHWVKSGVGIACETSAREDSFCDTTIRSDEPLVVNDLAADVRFADNPHVVDGGVRFYAGHPLTTTGGYRVGALCLMDSQPRELTDADLELLRDLAAWVEKELVIDEELERAAEVQKGLLPRTAPDVAGWDVAGACLPAREVGGDLLDWHTHGDRVFLTLGDVMGKGMAAAIMAASLRAVLRGATRWAGLAEAVAQAGESMASDFSETGAYATVFHAALEPHGMLRYVDAGHGLAWIVRANGDLRPLRVRGLPAGVLPDATWEEDAMLLAPGDLLVVVSDGVLDAVGDTDALIELVCKASTGDSARFVVEQILHGVKDLVQPDDLTALVVRRAA